MNGVSDEKLSTYHLHFIKFVGITSTFYGSISQNTSVNVVSLIVEQKVRRFQTTNPDVYSG